MKRNITRTLLVITCLATFTVSMVSTTQAQCSNATAVGVYEIPFRAPPNDVVASTPLHDVVELRS